ncbi:MAG: PAS domain-containing protein [Mucilaginibacter polytrichastri]|nr:PAS domain-containing protein [Mucilaginibacter polytrichastri]
MLQNELADQGLHDVLAMSDKATAVYVTDQIVIRWASKGMLDFWDQDESVIGTTLEEAVPELEGQPFIGMLKRVWNEGITLTGNDMAADLRVGEKISRFYFDFEYRAILNEDGTTRCILHTATDVTESYVKRQEVEETERRFRSMAEDSDILISVSDDTSGAIYFSKAWVDLTGRTMGDLLEFGWADLVHPDDRERYVNLYLSAFEKRASFTGEFRILDRDGNYRWLLAKGPPRFRPDGSFAGYISSCMDITEQKKDEQRKDDFIGMVSHELKTPLTSIYAYVQLLLGYAENSGDKMSRGMLEKVQLQLRKMTTMINGFLNVSRLESGKIYIDLQHFDLRKLVDEFREDIQATISTHNFAFDLSAESQVKADREKIGHVLSNFISNAVKYSPFNSTIYISCRNEEGEVIVSVRDQGMGISKHDQKHLFDRYYRVENHEMKTIAGFGIGLYLSAEIIHRHNGHIWVESETGKGSTFSFSLKMD